MTRRNRSNNSVAAGMPLAGQSASQPTRWPRQKNNIRIRGAKQSDASQLAVLMCQLGYATKRTEMETRLNSILSDPAYKTFVAVRNDRLCGMIGAFTYSSYEHNDPSGRILALVIKSTERRRGIGRALLASVEKDFAQKGIRRIALDTRLSRKDAHRFYQSLGYKRNGWRFVKQLQTSN